MTEESHHRVGRAANPRIRGCRVLCNRLRTNPNGAGTFLNLAVVAVLDVGMVFVARDQQESVSL